MSEVLVKAEGTFTLVQASASANPGWTTGAAAPSGVVGFVNSFSYTSARNLVTMSDRGVPKHHKNAGANPVDLTVNLYFTGSGVNPLTASGATVPMVHGELKYRQAQFGGNTAQYMQFYGLALQQVQLTENDDGVMIALTFRGLGMNGPTGSGYLS